ncbi:histidine kinase, partial [candidate division KSB1 bacterium]|nr:histidine kinase [candidate division KSB1 bacterium]
MFAESFRNGAAKALMAGIGMLSTLPTADAPAQPREFKFEHVSVELGLSQCSVGAIFQDRQGFLWFGTSDGLNRYDGYSFKHYKHDPGNSNSLSHNNMSAITEDHDGMLWFGTVEAGLNKFDRKSGTFTRYRHDPADSSSLASDHISNLCLDANGVLWIGTFAGLSSFHPETQTFVRYRHDPQNPQSLSHPYVRRIYEDRAGTLWMIAGWILHKFDRATGSFKRYDFGLRKTNDGVVALHEDSRGTFWLGTARSGLMIFDRNNEQVTHH